MVLLITADSDAALVYGEALGSLGHRVLVSSDAIPALRLAIRDGLDLVVADAEATPLDGFAIAAVLSVERLTAHVPVLILAMRDDPSYRGRAADVGAAGVLVRPLPSMLADEVAGRLRRKVPA
ncbi:MAG TPA: response regulator [Candidatus Dormibacteraeota bacterium]